MVSDRIGSLTVQAALAGVVDFSQANRFDRNWWRKLRLLTDGIDRQNSVLLLTQELSSNTQIMLSPAVAQDPHAFELLHRQQENLQKRLESACRPWIKFQQKSQQDTIKAMSQRYVEEFMDPASPEFDEELRRLEAHWASNQEDPNF